MPIFAGQYCAISLQVGTNSTDVGTGVSVDLDGGENSYGVAVGGYTGGSLAAPSGEKYRRLLSGIAVLLDGALPLWNNHLWPHRGGGEVGGKT